jgi:hypothetical protein
LFSGVFRSLQMLAWRILIPHQSIDWQAPTDPMGGAFCAIRDRLDILNFRGS